MRLATRGRLAVTGLALAGVCASILLRRDSRLSSQPNAATKLAGSAPATMVWAWEEPEDLRSIDPQQVGVAFLAERVFLGETVQVIPRRQSILVPDQAFAVAVVRLETIQRFTDSSQLRIETAAAILRAAALPNLHGVQIDFDATVSQRPFYADVLQEVRSRLPPGMGLTMTALVSWCASPDGWLKNLPVDAAVPMYFRLGKHIGQWPLREPRCIGNVGLSLDEPGMESETPEGIRTYLFTPRPWTAEQLAVLNRQGFPFNTRSGR